MKPYEHFSCYTSLRKLMRAARNGRLPEERRGMIEQTQTTADARIRDGVYDNRRRKR